MKKICSPDIANTIVKANFCFKTILNNLKKFKTRTKFISCRIDQIRARDEKINEIFEMQMDELKQFTEDYLNESSIDVNRIINIQVEVRKQIRNKNLKQVANGK